MNNCITAFTIEDSIPQKKSFHRKFININQFSWGQDNHPKLHIDLNEINKPRAQTPQANSSSYKSFKSKAKVNNYYLDVQREQLSTRQTNYSSQRNHLSTKYSDENSYQIDKDQQVKKSYLQLSESNTCLHNQLKNQTSPYLIQLQGSQSCRNMDKFQSLSFGTEQNFQNHLAQASTQSAQFIKLWSYGLRIYQFYINKKIRLARFVDSRNQEAINNGNSNGNKASNSPQNLYNIINQNDISYDNNNSNGNNSNEGAGHNSNSNSNSNSNNNVIAINTRNEPTIDYISSDLVSLQKFHTSTLQLIIQRIKFIQAIFQKNKSKSLEEMIHLQQQFASVENQQNNPQLLMYLMLKLGKILSIMLYYQESIKLVKVSKRMASRFQEITIMMKCFKILGINYMKLFKFKLAQSNLIKYLQTAWYCESAKEEIKAYELFGILNYYQGNLKLAEYYHTRSFQWQIESNTSEKKMLIINNIVAVQKKKKWHQIQGQSSNFNQKNNQNTAQGQTFININQHDIIDHDTDEEEFGQIKLVPEPDSQFKDNKSDDWNEFKQTVQGNYVNFLKKNKKTLRNELEFIIRNDKFDKMNKSKSNSSIRVPKQIDTQEFLAKKFIYSKKKNNDYAAQNGINDKYYMSHNSQNQLFSFIQKIYGKNVFKTGEYGEILFNQNLARDFWYPNDLKKIKQNFKQLLTNLNYFLDLRDNKIASPLIQFQNVIKINNKLGGFTICSYNV
eukprot:TRINITY_DN126_c0_g6_i2.p1 TRINITY_DN126_c0_g6~~TRINITY_DN126_c0_g6_i2.p1  ORF type:complete len:728 (+),score=105.19 TRINITY_DN126_c0_g6_i2:37-2220(+)